MRRHPTALRVPKRARAFRRRGVARYTGCECTAHTSAVHRQHADRMQSERAARGTSARIAIARH